MEPRHVDWLPPDSFDEYRLVKLLGRGSMGQVWLAHDTVLDRLVAVKFLAEHAGRDTVHQRFLTEARAAARLQHPNIIAVYRVGEIGLRPYLISEYVRGDSLDKIARPVAWPRLLELAIGLARGLAAAHRQGVLHRDLRPANAIVAETGEVKLGNFGLAKLLPHAVPPHAEVPADRGATHPDAPGDPTLAPHASRPPFVQPLDPRAGTVQAAAGVPARTTGGDIALLENTTDVVMGTPAYLSPEAWRGEPATTRSDVYSLGALLYALGAGAPPRGDSPEAMILGEPPPLASAAPGIDPGFAAVVDRCLRYDPAERFASGDAVRAALEALAAGDQASARGLVRAPRERPSSRRRWAILAGTLVLALVAYRTLGGAHSRPPVDAAATVHAPPDAPRFPVEVARAYAPVTGASSSAAASSAAPGRCPGGMIPVPAGTFRIGSPEGEGDADERPQHEVTLSAYCIDQTEVTVAAYADCVAAGRCSKALLTTNWTSLSAAEGKRLSRWCNRTDRPDHPINCVDWQQAAAYCTWQGKRLPTEAEWEHAARGHDGRRYPWGNAAPSARRVNACGGECSMMWRRDLDEGEPVYGDSDGWEATARVGSFPEGKSPFGVLDMAGNVGEWTADWYGGYAKQAETNPQGPRTGTSRVSRGGGWSTSDPDKLRAADRDWSDPMLRAIDLGFRCARGR